MRDAEAVAFAGGTLDKAAHLRGDPAALEALARAPNAGCLPLWRGRPLLDLEDGARLGWLDPGHPVLAADPGPAVFLGLAEDGAPRFARDLAGWPGPADAGSADARPFDDGRVVHPDLPARYVFGDLRAAMAALSPAEAGAAAAAKGVLSWHETHPFCARCGAPSRLADGGWKRVCPSCGAQHFPRTDPVVIMLVTHGEEVLLGRQAAWPPGMYSLLAGFMEPGESIEAAVRRETFEEAGIAVGPVDYLSSQPWPFPSSLMIGCRGLALDREIRRDPAELEDARWVSREACLAAIMGRDPDLKPARRGSIARFLIERWLADDLA